MSNPRRNLTIGSRPAEIPLSFAQARLWFLNRLAGSKPNYNESLQLRFKRDFQHRAMAQALADVVTRHETLRTIFPESGGVPRQVVLSPELAAVRLKTIDVSREAFRAEMARARREEEFDLTRDIPIRAFVFAAGDNRVLLLVVHHIAVDWWSIQRNLVRDLLYAYDSRRAGGAPSFQPLPVQYADFALWERETLGSRDDPSSLHASQMAFWRRALDGVPKETLLPADRQRALVPSFKGGGVAALIDRRSHAALLALARRERATLFMVLYACLAALLTRMGAGADLPIGTPVSGRRFAELNDVVGFFANTVVLRADTSGNPTCRELLQRVRPTVLDACAHDLLPFEQIVEALNPARVLARNPLFQVMFGFRTHVRSAERRTGSRKVSNASFRGPGQVRFDLTFDVTEQRGADRAPRGLLVQVQYSADLFDRATAEQLLEGFGLVIGAFLESPDDRIGQIDVVGVRRRVQVLDAGRGPVIEAGRTVLSLFQQEVRRAPSAPAARCGAARITYGELNAAANRLAHRLIALGARPEDVVAVAVPRSLDVVVRVLAVLKAGAACLLLDLEHPAEHLERIIRVVAPKYVLTTDAVPLQLARSNLAVISDDGQNTDEPAAEATAQDPRIGIPPQAAALVAVTAGRTGEPKAVTITHAGLDRAAHIWRELTSPAGSGGAFTAAPLGADVALVELLAPLTRGLDVVLASEEEVLYPQLFSEGTDERPRVAQGTPARIRRWLPHLSHRNQCYLIGRDVGMSSDVVETIVEVGGTVDHLYGTTEACIWTTGCRLSERTDDPVPAGRPLAGATVYVLDERLQPVPVGVSGAIYVGGLIGRGYHRAPGLTAASFVADPFGESGSRMFRTGDRGRWTNGGILELLPPRELLPSAALATSTVRRLRGVSDAEIVVQHDEDGRARRVLFVTLDPEHPASIDDIQSWLEQTLPIDALPDVVTQLDRLPLRPNGTIDHRALRLARSIDTHRDVSSPLQEKVCALVAEVLQRQTVAPSDNFFDLGGHSLSVMQVLNRIRSSFGIELDVRSVFEAQTVAGLSRSVEASVARQTRQTGADSARPVHMI